MKTRTAVLVALLIALVAGYLVSGHYFYKAPIGLDQSAFLAGEWIYGIIGGSQGSFVGMVLMGASLLAVVLLAFFWVRSVARAQVDPSRRRFLTGAGSGAGAALLSLLGAGGAAAARGLLGWGQSPRGWLDVGTQIQADVVRTHPEALKKWEGARVEGYRRLGRTGWKVSDIVLGTGRIRGEDGEKIARQAIERGVNYFDTSPDYSGAGSEQAMGRAMKSVRRDQMFIATKFCTPTGHLPPGTPVARYEQVIEESLGRLGTDYVDLVHVHSCDEVDRLMDPNVHEAFDRLKQDGKVRFLGFSTHTPNLVEVAETGIASGRFDVMMLAYHYGMWESLGGIIAKGRKEQDMGVVAMKTLMGAKHDGLEGFLQEEKVFSQAALRWTLSNPDVSCAVISFYEPQHVDEYLYASGKKLGRDDVAVLEKYRRLTRGTYCAPHCGACLSSCPEQLAIHDVLRHRMYFEDYGWEKEGIRLYSQLEKNAAACLTCSAPCTGTCPNGLPIRERMLGAHELLTLG